MFPQSLSNLNYPFELTQPRPTMAIARIHGSPLAPNLKGYVMFQDVPNGTFIYENISGLPPYRPPRGGQSAVGPHGFHIHEKGICEIENPNDPYQSTGGHWNPDNQPHGHHAGDFPVIFSNNGISVMSFFTNRFKVHEIIGKSIVIHQNPDDYRTQPAGNSGKRIGCGVITPYRR